MKADPISATGRLRPPSAAADGDLDVGLALALALALVLALVLASACGSTSKSPSSSPASTEDGGAQGAGSAADGSIATVIDGGAVHTAESGAAGDAAPLSSCVPAIPSVGWTSPYAGWSRGVPTDPSFFPIGVWLQGSWHATEMASLGVNVYIGNN